MDETYIPVTEPVPMSPKERFSRMGVALLLIAAVSLVGQILAMALTMILVPDRIRSIFTSENGLWLLSFLPMYCLAVPVGLLMMCSVPATPGARNPLGRRGFWKYLLMCFPVLVGGNLLGSWLAMLLSTGQAEDPLLEFATSTNPLKILFMVILAPILEELVFRKSILDRAAAYGEKTAVLFSALCFGMFHMNLYQFFYAFGIGVIFGYVYLRTRDLRYSIGMHMIINFLGGVVAPCINNGMQSLDSALPGAPESFRFSMELYGGELRRAAAWICASGLYSMIYMGMTIAGLVLLIQNWKKAQFQVGPEELPRQLRRKVVYGNPGVILFLVATGIMTVVTLATV